MISHEYRAEYLDPVVWNRVGTVIAPFAAANTRGTAYDPERIRAFYHDVQTPGALDQEIDRYEHFAWDRFRAGFPECAGTCHAEGTLLRFLEEKIPKEDCAVLFWITDKDGRPYYHCIFRIEDGKITLVTTADRYAIAPDDAGQPLLKCEEAIRKEFGTKVLVTEYSLEEWVQYAERWIAEAEKKV